MENISLDLLAKQQERILDRMHAMEESMTAVTGMLIRIEGAIEGLRMEMRGVRGKTENL